MTDDAKIELRKWCLYMAYESDARRFKVDTKPTPAELIESAKEFETYING